MPSSIRPTIASLAMATVANLFVSCREPPMTTTDDIAFMFTFKSMSTSNHPVTFSARVSSVDGRATAGQCDNPRTLMRLKIMDLHVEPPSS